jgi:histidinol-phosphatase (PHP family)
MIDVTCDSHVHTNWSPDADPEATFEAMIAAAKAAGLTRLVFTDHVDIDAVHPLFHTPIDYDAYIQAFRKIQRTAPIEIVLGVEVGYQSHVKEEIQAFLDRYDFDFVILSIHYLEQKDLYTQEYFAGKTKEEAYSIYFDTLYEAITTIEGFDVVGHLDYIPRYAPFDDYDLASHQHQIDRILRALIQQGNGIEINTSGYLTEGRMYPRVEVVQRFLELGGTTITIGSDAHRPSEIGRYFDTVKTHFPTIL